MQLEQKNPNEDPSSPDFYKMSQQALKVAEPFLPKTAADTDEKEEEFLEGCQSPTHSVFGVGSNPGSPQYQRNQGAGSPNLAEEALDKLHPSEKELHLNSLFLMLGSGGVIDIVKDFRSLLQPPEVGTKLLGLA